MNKRNKTMSLTKLLIIDFIILLIASIFVFKLESIVTQQEKEEEIFQTISGLTSSVNMVFDDMDTAAVQYHDLFDQEAEALAFVDDHVEGFEINDSIRDVLPNTVIHVNSSEKNDKSEFYSDAQSQNGTSYHLELADHYDSAAMDIINWSDASIDVMLHSDNDLIFMIKKDGTIVYSDDESLKGKQVSDLGFEVSDLVLDETVQLNIKGKECLTAASYDEALDLIMVYVTNSQIFNINNRICAAVICGAMMIIVTLIITYSYFLRQKEIESSEQEDFAGSTYRVHKNHAIISVLGLLLIAVVSFHFQSLFSVSMFSMQKDNDMICTNLLIDGQVDSFNSARIVNNYVASEKKDFLLTLLSNYPELRSKENLSSLKSILGLPYIELYNSKMEEIATTIEYKGQFDNYENSLDLLEDVDYIKPKDQLSLLIKDVEFSSTEALQVSDERTPYYISIGYPLDIYTPIISDWEVQNFCSKLSTTEDNPIFVIDPETKTILYSSLPDYTDVPMDYAGFTDQSLDDHHLSQMRIDNKDYYTSSYFLDTKLIFLLQDANIMFKGRFSMMSATMLLSALCLAILHFILHRSDVSSKSTENVKDTKWTRILGKVLEFFDIDDGWASKTPEDKAITISRVIFHVISFIIIGIVLFRNSISNEDTIFGFIVNNKWAKGFNIFSITAVIIVCFVYSFIISIVRFIFRKLFKVVSSKSETFLRLIRSFLIYATMLGLLFYCLYLLGLDPASLLASAGLAGFVISLGAKDLITDILAGLFIIFENQFQVGDMIQIGPDLGAVLEIGVRTTRIKTIPGDVLCIGNRNLSNVINKTRTNTNSSVILSVSYKQNIDAIEKMLKEEVPKLSEVLPIKPIAGPIYFGIIEFTDRYVKMFVGFTSKEQDRFNLTCALNTELCRLFDEHGFELGIKPVEYKK